MLTQLGRLAVRARYLIIAGWAVIALLGGVFGGSVYDRAQSVDSLRPDAESTLLQKRLDRMSPEGELVLAVITGRDFFSVDLADSASRVMFEIRAIPGVAEVTDAYTSGSYKISADRKSSLVIVELRPELSEPEALAVADQVAAKLHTINAPEVLVGGELLAKRSFGDQAIKDAAIGESIALVVLCLALITILGGLIAGSLPLAAALATIASTLLILTGLAGAMPVSEYAVNVVTILGIGLAVDYSLLIVSRFQQERAADQQAALPELLARTLSTSGRAVLVSGLAVGTALTGLFVFADPLLSAMALGGALVVCLATLAGLTLVPALIAVAHRRIPAGNRVWRSADRRKPALLTRLATFAQRRPAKVALAVTAGLLVLSAPLLSANLANSDARSLPESSEARRVHEIVEKEFSAGQVEPITVVVDAQQNSLQPLIQKMRALHGATDVDVESELTAESTVIEITPAGTASGQQAQQLVREIRALDPKVKAAGPAAELVDAKDSTADRLPIALAVIILATGLLLFALTRSVVIPLKALCMNILTLLATLGVLVAIFQWGWGASLFGFKPWGALDVTTPLLLFVFIFGLSMDYEVFLLARIKEEWDKRTSDSHEANDRAVLAGITATGPVITTAALAIGIVFLGFALGELVAVKEIGIGMTIAVLLDVTVVRGLLLPAVMSLLGRVNWWRPAFRLGRAVPQKAAQ
ncbi:putative membrane protein [Rhizocola hellebori]|uniref:Putative membrane protein n=1 Tax=Rhizocola hellebori TaxID=1392758 RepID=A0A8J3VKN9_9ACTN|nr:MMPL family transporter [Rhizocola hellebori]GIH09732.1 putative membrane protein [Rhizocola hellebori]